MQRHSGNEMERERGRERKRERGREAQWEEEKGLWQPEALSPIPLCYPPNHETSLSMTTATPFISFPQLEVLFLSIQSNDVWIYLSSNMVIEVGGGQLQTAEDRFVAVQDQEQWHITTVETVIASQRYTRKYFPRNVHDNHNSSSSNTQVAARPSALGRLITQLESCPNTRRTTLASRMHKNCVLQSFWSHPRI